VVAPRIAWSAATCCRSNSLKLLLGQRGIHSPSTPRLHVSVFGPFCLVPPSPFLRGGPGGCQRRRAGVGSYQSFGLCRAGGAGKKGSVAGTAAGLLCTRYIGLATQARWSSSQTTRLPQAQSQLHKTWHTKYDAQQVWLLTCCVQSERSSVQVNQVEFRSCVANQTER